MDTYLAELWQAAKQAGPFATMILMVLLYVVNAERKSAIEKYDSLVARFISLAGDTQATLKDWRDLLLKARKDDE